MNEVLHANVFFFITSIAVIVFTILLCMVLYQVLKISKSVRRIVDRIEEGSEVIAEDMAYVRKYFAEGSLISHVIGLFFNRSGHTAKRSTKRKTKRSGSKIAVDDED